MKELTSILCFKIKIRDLGGFKKNHVRKGKTKN